MNRDYQGSIWFEGKSYDLDNIGNLQDLVYKMAIKLNDNNSQLDYLQTQLNELISKMNHCWLYVDKG